MKNRLLAAPSHHHNQHVAPRRTAGWIVPLSLAALVATPAALFGEILDNFEDPAWSAQAWTTRCLFGTCGSSVTGGQLRLAMTPSGDHGFSVYTYNQRTFLLDPRRTVEFRVDLINCNADGATAWLQFTPFPDHFYALGIDPDSLGVSKGANPSRGFFLTNGVALDTQNVKLVLTMTGGESEVIIRVRSIDNETGGVLFDRQFRDTANQDPLPIGTDVPQASYLGNSGRFELVLYHDNAGSFDPDVALGHNEEAVAVFDNAEVLEYDSAWMNPPSNSILLTWPEHTAEEMTAVSADSVEGPYDRLCPEPISKRFGQFCLAVPTTARAQFIRLVPGTQFVDDFDPPKWPYATKGDWVPWFYHANDNATRWSVTAANAVLRARTLQTPADATGRLAITPPGPLVSVRDFYASVDILDLTATHENGLVQIAARTVWDPDSGFPGNSNGYLGGVAPNGDGVNRAQLNFFPGAWPPIKGKVFAFKPGTPYRLIFSGVGQRFSVELVDLDTGQAPVERLEVANPTVTFTQGFVGLFVQTGGPAVIDAVLDNFFVTGTKPSP